MDAPVVSLNKSRGHPLVCRNKIKALKCKIDGCPALFR